MITPKIFRVCMVVQRAICLNIVATFLLIHFNVHRKEENLVHREEEENPLSF